MSIRSLASLLSLILAVATATARADDAPAATPAAPAHGKKEHTPLEKQMSRIRKSMRALHSQIGDPAKNPSSIDLVATIHDAATTSLDLTPAKASDFTGVERDTFIAHYRSAMKDFIASVDSLTAALKANDNAAAEKIYKELPSEEKKDHKAFRRPEKDAKAPAVPAPAAAPAQP